MLGHLHTALTRLEAEIQRLEKHQAVVRSGRERIRSEGAGREYVVGEQALQRKLKEYREACTETKAMIKTAESVLAMAATKMFPGRKPRHHCAAFNLHGSPVSTATLPHGPRPTHHDPSGIPPEQAPQGPSIGDGVDGPMGWQ